MTDQESGRLSPAGANGRFATVLIWRRDILIPTIGLMIGFYIITKMLSLESRKGAREESAGVRVMALLTILVATGGIVSLLVGGVEVGQKLERFVR